MELEDHYTNRSGWLRAAVLGANDGILSTTSIAIGVAAASTTRGPIILAALAGLVAGALSMAAGEYVSVSSQSDIETADLEREKKELETTPEIELKELAKIYQKRGLDSELSLRVAQQLTKHDALEAHAKDELGINEFSTPKPLQAALASGASFISGGLLPFLVSLFAPVGLMVYFLYGSATVFLALSGGVAAKAGGANIPKGIIRICFWGTVAMGITALVGYIFGVKTA
ncbi:MULTISPECIES: VIT family protein [unclassified Mucilaginibacter]|uniref:VIT1/CCC1 transporter family protein n=1 Tax=unclassified Mucilaginibacter TaxID=2617802 RepID=UPI002AC98D35|nr:MULTISPECIES: VIT family protein [unclassified Mucilaginibacter]MEB0262638.1 VIT family protein [Mucilaginibacter sp. 10I4]MEB0280590.1 VIT family protein [Mucilaginibacter sp. 10B2]MEB0300788.1 VIT family protein [Mucilaginibacter sp. 5C4]WPX24992.1 VIT family protein [Mucilaginibacter sp. 5C4]